VALNDIARWGLEGKDCQWLLEIRVYKRRGFHGGDYEEWCLLGCYAV
jgi:hypothetical protein